MIDLEFIDRCNQTLKDQIHEARLYTRKLIKDWQQNRPEDFKKCQKRYFDTEKGKIALRRKYSVRHQRLKRASDNLSPEDLEMIRDFYVNCPEGWEVDHIHPISKGGKHHISNLQYLTKEDNRRKSASLTYIPKCKEA